MFCFCKRRILDFKFNPVQSLGIFRNLDFLTKISFKLLTFYQVISKTIANLTYINISVYLHAVYVSSSILFPGFWLKALVFYKDFSTSLICSLFLSILIVSAQCSWNLWDYGGYLKKVLVFYMVFIKKPEVCKLKVSFPICFHIVFLFIWTVFKNP